MQIDYPWHIDPQRRTASIGEDAHVRDLIEQVLFTNQGERVNRPDFGCNLMQLVFAGNSDELASATQFLVQGALQQWLGELIQVEAVEVNNRESTLQITVRYRMKRNQSLQSATFEREY